MKSSGILGHSTKASLVVAARRLAIALALTIGFGLNDSEASYAEDFKTACATPPVAPRQTFRATPSTLASVLKIAKSGDLITLEGGRYGPVQLRAKNTEFVTVTARTGQLAILSSVTIQGSHWVVRDVTIDGSSVPSPPAPNRPGRWPIHDWLVKIYGADNTMVLHSIIRSRAGAFPWRPETKDTESASSDNDEDPAPLYNGLVAVNAACVTVTQNIFQNVFNAMTVGGDQNGINGKHYHITDNRIDDYAGDGIDHAGSDMVIARNVIINSHDLCDYQCLHADGIQGWNFNGIAGVVNNDITIDSNIIVQRTRDHLVRDGNSLQGITIFNGHWNNVRVINNIVATDTWHGITISGVNGLIVENNTVIATNWSRKTWISAGGVTHEGGLSRNVTVRNNIATALQPQKGAVEGLRVDHNLIVDDPRRLFAEFNVPAGRFDFHLRPGSAAIGRGTDDGMPMLDADRSPRTAPVNLGAYQDVRSPVDGDVRTPPWP